MPAPSPGPSPLRPSPTIREVAQAAGVSVATISRVMNGRAWVSKALRQRVQETILRLGYRQRPAAHRPGPKVKSAVDFPVIPSRPVIDLYIAFPLKLGQFTHRAPIYSRALDDLEELAVAAGLDLCVRQDQAPFPDRLRERLAGRIYFGTGFPEVAGPWPDPHLPQVWLFAGDTAAFPGDGIRVDHERIGEIAVRHFLGRGHRRAGFLGSPHDFANGLYVTRQQSIAFWGRRLGLEITEMSEAGLTSPGLPDGRSGELLAELLGRWLDQPVRPTALYLDYAAFVPAVWEYLVRQRLRPMVDLDILVCNRDDPFLRGIDPQPGIIDLPTRAMAGLALDLVRRPVDRKRPTVRHCFAPVLLEP